MTNQTDVTIYLYADLLNGKFDVTNYNFWNSAESKATGLFKSQSCARKLLEIRTIDLSRFAYFDFTTGKIQALEMQLGDLHIQSENIKQQIQELLCIGHDTEPTDWEPMPEGPNGGIPVPPSFDDDIPY